MGLSLGVNEPDPPTPINHWNRYAVQLHDEIDGMPGHAAVPFRPRAWPAVRWIMLSPDWAAAMP